MEESGPRTDDETKAFQAAELGKGVVYLSDAGFPGIEPKPKPPLHTDETRVY
jgi:hypothetical protein